jgi:uncharacterized protein (TIGR02448 family)
MPRLPLIAATALLLFAANACATSFVMTTDAIGSALVGSTDSLADISSSFDDDKIVLAAREDAASFVASAGALRGARLEAALLHIRQRAPQLHGSDLQLAQAILAL